MKHIELQSELLSKYSNEEWFDAAKRQAAMKQTKEWFEKVKDLLE